MVAVFSNARTTVSAKKEGEDGWREAFNTAFRAGGVMGYSLCALSLMILYLLCLIYRHVLQIDGNQCEMRKCTSVVTLKLTYLCSNVN